MTLLSVVAVVGAVYFLLPLCWLVVAASKATDELASTPPLQPGSLSELVTNVVSVFTTSQAAFPRWMLNSIGYAGLGGVGATLISGLAGYTLARLRFRGRTVVTGAVLVATMTPATVLAFPTYLVLTKLGLVNTFVGLLLPSMLSPVSVFLARMFAQQSVPRELVEAARVDGAGELWIAARIGLRLMVPGLVTILLMQVVAIWNSFFLPLIVLTDQRLFPVTLGLYLWNTQVASTPFVQGMVITGSLVSAIPMVVLFLSLQRYWRSGMLTGAVK